MDQKNLKQIVMLSKQIETLSQGITDAANPNKQTVKDTRVNAEFNEVVKHTANIVIECKKIRKAIGAKP
jgi:hypothetical protein